MPQRNYHGSRKDTDNHSSISVPEYLEQKNIQKLLLLGYEGSGTSTIFKQVNAKQLGNISMTTNEITYLYWFYRTRDNYPTINRIYGAKLRMFTLGPVGFSLHYIIMPLSVLPTQPRMP